MLHLTSPASGARTGDVQHPVLEKLRTHAGTFVKILFVFGLAEWHVGS